MRRNNPDYMATYKKRGHKPKSRAEKQEALEDQSQTAEVFKSLDAGASRTEQWVIKNQKLIFAVIGLAAVLVLGYLGYNKFIQEPKEIEAMNDLYPAQQLFEQAVNGTEKDSLYTLALEGEGGKFGLLEVISNYGNTDAGNLANYYAGMAYLNLKNYQEAINYLNEFSSDDDALGPIAKGAIADAFVQLEQKEEALEYYLKAANLKTNDFTTPMYLYKAGNIALELGDKGAALAAFNRIKEEFPSSSEATNIDAFIGRAEASVN